jgi:hypothetical protein
MQGGAARLDGAVAGDAQLADRFDDPVGVLRDRGRVAGQHGAGGLLGVDPIALAAPAARMRVRAVDLDHRDLAAAQIAH